MITFTCKFCKAILEHPEFYAAGVYDTQYDFHCSKCVANYYIDCATRRTMRYTLWTPKYQLHFMSYGGFMVDSRDRCERLLELDQYPDNITPENAEKKINLLITFS